MVGYGALALADNVTTSKNSAGQIQVGAGIGTLAARPAAATQGRQYYGSDTNTIYYDTGSAWVTVAASSVANTFSQLITFQSGLAFNPAVADSSVAGKLFLSSTTANTLKYYDTAGTPALHTLSTLEDAKTFTAVQTFGNNISIGGAQFNIASLATGDIIYKSSTNWANLAVGGAGQVLGVSAGLPAWVASPTISTSRLSADFTTTSGTAQNTGLTLALAANTNYTFHIYFRYSPGAASTANQFIINALAAGASLVWIGGTLALEGSNFAASAQYQIVVNAATGANLFATNPTGTASFYFVHLHGLITVGITATTLQLNCTSDGTATLTLKAGAFIEASKVT